MDTIVSLIEGSCRRFADRVAMLEKGQGGWRGTSYAELWSASDRIAAGLTEAGFQPGEHAALLAASSPSWLTSYLGVLKKGGWWFPSTRS